MQAQLTNILDRHPTDSTNIVDPMTSPTTHLTTANRRINSVTIENLSQVLVVGSANPGQLLHIYAKKYIDKNSAKLEPV